MGFCHYVASMKDRDLVSQLKQSQVDTDNELRAMKYLPNNKIPFFAYSVTGILLWMISENILKPIYYSSKIKAEEIILDKICYDSSDLMNYTNINMSDDSL